MVWPFSGPSLFSRFKAAPPPAKKATPARKAPVSPATEARLINAWELRTVGELRDTLEEVGWDVESLERLLQRVGAPEEPAGAVQPAARRMLASSDKPKKRPRSPLLPDDDEDDDEEFDLSPRAAAGGKKQARAGRPPRAVTPTPPAAKSPARQSGKSPAAMSPPRSNTKSPSRPSGLVAAEVEAMSPSQLKSEFERIFGYRPKSGNMYWLRRKLDALKKGTDLNVGSGNRGRPPTHVLPGGASP